MASINDWAATSSLNETSVSTGLCRTYANGRRCKRNKRHGGYPDVHDKSLRSEALRKEREDHEAKRRATSEAEQQMKNVGLAATRLKHRSTYENFKHDAAKNVNPAPVKVTSETPAAKKGKWNKKKPRKEQNSKAGPIAHDKPETFKNPILVEHLKPVPVAQSETKTSEALLPIKHAKPTFAVPDKTEAFESSDLAAQLKLALVVQPKIELSKPTDPIEHSSSETIVCSKTETLRILDTAPVLTSHKLSATVTLKKKKKRNSRKQGKKDSKKPDPKPAPVVQKEIETSEALDSIEHCAPGSALHDKNQILKTLDTTPNLFKAGAAKTSKKWGKGKQQGKKEKTKSIPGCVPEQVDIVKATNWKKNSALQASRIAVEESNRKPDKPSIQLVQSPSWDPRVQYHSGENELLAWAKENLRDSTRTRLLAPYILQGEVPIHMLRVVDTVPGTKGKFFKHFSLLPMELRLQIWEYAMDDSYYDCMLKHEFDYFQDGNYYGSRLRPITTAPPFLHACSESREIAVKRFEWTFGTKEYEPMSRFSYLRDRLWLLTQGPQELPYMASLFMDFDIRRIRRLCVPLRDFVKDSDQFCRSIVKFRHLQHLWLVVGDGKEDEMFSKDKHLLNKARKLMGLHWEACFKNSKRVRNVPMVLLHVIDAVRAHRHGIDGIHW